MNKTWTVVKFLEENSVEAVPTSWLIGNRCVWPPYPREKVINSIRNYEDMNTCWPSHKISIFRDATYNTYLEARNKTKIAEYSSDLNEGDSKSRKYRKKKNSILSSDESEEEEDYSKLPPPPSKPRNINTTNNFDEMISSSPRTTLSDEAPLKLPAVFASDKEDSCLCCPIHGKQKTDEAIKKITKQYYFISNILTDMNLKLENLRTNPANQESLEEIDSLFTKFPIFPLKNAEDLNMIEEYLGEKSNFTTAELLPLHPPLFSPECLMVNDTGKLLAVAGPCGVLVMQLPARCPPYGAFEKNKEVVYCRSHSLDERLLSCSDTVEVRQAKFHPGSIHHNHILILTSDNMLRLYQIKETEALNIAVYPVGEKPAVMFPGSKTPFLDIYGEIAVDFDFGHPDVVELPPTTKGTNERGDSKSITMSKEEKYMINVETQTVDKIMTKDPTWNKTDWDKLVWPVYILRGDMTVYSLNIDLKKRWKPFLRGPLPMSGLENGEQNEACSLICLNTVPQIMCIAQSNGTLCHTVLLEIEEDIVNKMKDTGKSISSIPTKEIIAFETIELELGLTTNEDDLDSKYKCPIFLKKDDVKSEKYYATHSAGVHSVVVSCVKELQGFVDSQEAVDPTSDIFTNHSRAEYVVCTKTTTSQKVNPVIGFASYYEPPAVIALLSNGNLVTLGTMYTSEMPKIEDLTVHDDDDMAVHLPLRKMLQEPFDQYIQNILKKSSTQPILKLGSTGKPNQEECYELLQRAAQSFREEYFKNHAKAREELEKRVHTLQMMKRNQQKEIRCMNDERDRMQEKASNLAEKYEDIKDKQDDLLKMCENLLMLVSRKKSAPSDAENAFKHELHVVEQKVVAYGNKIDKIKNKMKYQQIQMESWKAQETKKVSTINATHTDTIKTNLQETKMKVEEMVMQINGYKKLLNLKNTLQ